MSVTLLATWSQCRKTCSLNHNFAVCWKQNIGQHWSNIAQAAMASLCHMLSLFILYAKIPNPYSTCGNNMPTRCNRCFLLQSLLLAQHVSGTIMPIIRSSRVLYSWLLPVVFGALVFKLSEWCGTEGCYLKQQPKNRTHNPQLYTIPTTWKPKHQIPQAATICIILSSSWWWA
jgi:hypothetical protein